MNTDMIMVAVGAGVLAINCTTMIITFPSKRSLGFTIAALLLFSAAFYTLLSVTVTVVPDKGGLPGLIYLPIMMALFEGRFFQKLFAYFLQFLFTAFQIALAEAIGGFFFRYGEKVSFVVFLLILFLLFTVYIVLVFKYGRRVFEKLFTYGRPAEWALYSFGAVFSFAVLAATQIAPGSSLQVVIMLLFILWSFGVLCFAIINTNEKSKQRYEAEMARGIISSSREHYQKMTEMQDSLRMLRHDYRYHLDVMLELIRSNQTEELYPYLTGLETQLAENKLPYYCPNSVINALLAGYGERCAKQNIQYDIKISMPHELSIPNYEMCIVLGNLLENAVHACEHKEGRRMVSLVINTQGAHLAVMVKNSFCGELVQAEGLPISAKKDGGFGLRSAQAVAARYGGELMVEWDRDVFTAYVLMRV